MLLDLILLFMNSIWLLLRMKISTKECVEVHVRSHSNIYYSDSCFFVITLYLVSYKYINFTDREYIIIEKKIENLYGVDEFIEWSLLPYNNTLSG